MTKRLLRALCVAVLGLVLFDGIADISCHDAQAGSVECHACACGPHIVPQNSSLSEVVPLPSTYVPYKTATYAFLLADPFFQPPKLAV